MFSWVSLSYPKDITLEQLQSVYMWRWSYLFLCALLYICVDGSSHVIWLLSHSSWKVLLQPSSISSHLFCYLAWYFQHFTHSDPFTGLNPFSSWAFLCLSSNWLVCLGQRVWAESRTMAWACLFQLQSNISLQKGVAIRDIHWFVRGRLGVFLCLSCSCKVTSNISQIKT